MSKLLELRPDRELLDPNFPGYKLSLEKLEILEKEFSTPIKRVLPSSDQYSLLHAKLFGLQNFLFVNHFAADSNTYFIDEDQCVQNIVSGDDFEVKKVWEVPKSTQEVNPILFFVSEKLVLCNGGHGQLFIVETGDDWKLEFGEKILENEQPFTIIDAVLLQNELHCLLYTIEKDENEKFYSLINWVVLSKIDSKWGPVQFKVLKGGQFYYCALERTCKNILIASDSPFKFILDSENPIVEDKMENKMAPKYKWQQNSEKIWLKIEIKGGGNSESVVKDSISVSGASNNLEIKFGDEIILNGELANGVDSDSTTWNLNGNLLEVVLKKSEVGLMWAELIKNDESGEQIFEPTVVEDVHRRLAHLCSETQEIPTEMGPSFSSQQMEECDLSNEELAIFERISGETHQITHRINLGSIQYITSLKLVATEAPAICLRHDVDGCVWQPRCDEAFEMKHEGTLLAFGYIQASKSQRKFMTSSPLFSYATICESSCHIFIYRQNRSITSGELRNRRSGRRVGSIAEQQLINIGDEEIFGIYGTESFLYLLLSNKCLIIRM